MIIDAISDLHGNFPKLEGGDLLILAGDYTSTHTVLDYLDFRDWLNQQKYKKKILIGGNHDTHIDEGNLLIDAGELRFTSDWIDCIWLEDSGYQVEGYNIWGSPWSVWFDQVNPRCTAWMMLDCQLEDKFRKIPKNTDILITHTPPYGYLDENSDMEHCGSRSLMQMYTDHLISPKVHFFGHIHERWGQEDKIEERFFTTDLYNVSVVDEWYRPKGNVRRYILD